MLLVALVVALATSAGAQAAAESSRGAALDRIIDAALHARASTAPVQRLSSGRDLRLTAECEWDATEGKCSPIFSSADLDPLTSAVYRWSNCTYYDIGYGCSFSADSYCEDRFFGSVNHCVPESSFPSGSNSTVYAQAQAYQDECFSSSATTVTDACAANFTTWLRNIGCDCEAELNAFYRHYTICNQALTSTSCNGASYSTPPAPDSESSSGLSTGAIIGIVVGALAAVGLIVGLVVVLCCCCKKDKPAAAGQGNSASADNLEKDGGAAPDPNGQDGQPVGIPVTGVALPPPAEEAPEKQVYHALPAMPAQAADAGAYPPQPANAPVQAVHAPEAVDHMQNNFSMPPPPQIRPAVWDARQHAPPAYPPAHPHGQHPHGQHPSHPVYYQQAQQQQAQYQPQAVYFPPQAVYYPQNVYYPHAMPGPPPPDPRQDGQWGPGRA